MQTLDFVSGLHNCLEFFQPLSGLYQAMQTRKTFSVAETNVMLYNMCHVMLYNMGHVMLYNMGHVMLYNMGHVMLYNMCHVVI